MIYKEFDIDRDEQHMVNEVGSCEHCISLQLHLDTHWNQKSVNCLDDMVIITFEYPILLWCMKAKRLVYHTST